MNQDSSYSSPLNSLKRWIVVVGLVFILILVYVFFANRHFHITGTNPRTSQVSTITPFLNIEFNKPISPKNISLKIEPDALSSYSVKGDMLYINFNNPLSLGKKYTLTINSIYSTTGEHLNKIISFKPKNIPFNQLPKDQQDAILKEQPQKADQNQEPNFFGMSAFINSGLTTDQVNALIKAFTKFAPKGKAFEVDSSSLVPQAHDRASADPFRINFNVSIDSTLYKGIVSYSNLSSVQLILLNSASQQVFDSGTITSYSQ